jgi:predicted ABC-type ATPase
MPGSRPCLVIVGGVNGCGKSTFARAAAGTPLLLDQTAINPDDLTVDAKKQAEKRGQKLGKDGANLVAVERAEKAVWQAIARRESVAIETVLSSEKFVTIVDAARDAGYLTRLIFVALPSVELAIGRVAARVKMGGHGVPEESIRARWKRSHRNLTRFTPLVDDLLVFSNENEPALLVAQRSGRTASLEILNPTALPIVTEALLRSQWPE